jgi:hypothetical protein
VTNLELPDAVRVRFSKTDAEHATHEIRAWLESDIRKAGLHASDILYPRLSYWKSVEPKPLTERQVGLFAAGRALHAIYNEARHGRASVDQGSEWSEDLGIWFSLDDYLTEEDDTPVELKTTRAFQIARTIDDVYDYLRQLAIYMVAKQKLKGVLRVWYLNSKDKAGGTAPKLVSVILEWSRTEFGEYREAIIAVRSAISDAVTRRDPSALPLCPAWMCARDKCPWFEDCKPEGRWTKPRRRKATA